MPTKKELEELEKIRRAKMGAPGGDFRSAGSDLKNLGVALKNTAAAGGDKVLQSMRDLYNAEGAKANRQAPGPNMPQYPLYVGDNTPYTASTPETNPEGRRRAAFTASTTRRDEALTGLASAGEPVMSPESQVGAIKRRPGLREKGSNMTLRDAAATPPSPQRQRAATPSRNAPTGLSGAPNFDYDVETIRGLNRSFTKYGRGEDGSWGLPERKIDYEHVPGMGSRLAYDSADPNYNEALQYGQDQEHDITLKELETEGKLKEQALRNKGMQQRAATTGKKDDAAKLATEISKSLWDDEGTKPVDLRTAAQELARLREMDEREAFELFTTMKDEHRETIIAFWKKMGII